ncbi:hypothetical protein AGR13a_Lc110299 [Agrobacterium genomosp. 13 str. CFBP 6927]|uniref:Uncharacterized protein n=1 Tax=Agrobacterium genomosp. 13 str. CFBP 6927 TaxID=1183428 RepID=A0ABM9VJU6_9HYPH|nr:hypothetical protein AGR13a_Lc110299 [Agrobacterium genomosp. 13 str. CFBP 6927]
MEGQLETVGITGLRQQFLGLVRVISIDLDCRIVTEITFGNDLTGRNALSIHDAVNKCFTVDRQGQGTAHFRLQKRVLAIRPLGERRFLSGLIHVEIHDAVAGNIDDLQLVGCLKPAGIGRRNAFDHVDITRKHGGNARARVLEDAEGHFVPGSLFAPIGIVPGNHDIVVRRPGHEFERAGADDALAAIHLARRYLFHFGRENGDTAEVVEQQRRRAGRRYAHGQRVNGGDLGDRLHIGGKRAWAVGRGQRDALDAGNHVLGGKIAAVVEFHAFAQLEFPGLVIDDFPGSGECGLYLLLLVLVDEAIENIARHRAVRADDVKLRIHGRCRSGKTNGEVLCLTCERHGENRRCQCGCESRKLHDEDSSGLFQRALSLRDQKELTLLYGKEKLHLVQSSCLNVMGGVKVAVETTAGRSFPQRHDDRRHYGCGGSHERNATGGQPADPRSRRHRADDPV